MPVDIERARHLAQELVDALTEAALPPELITLSGTIGRPEFKQVRGIPLFTAGLGIRRVDGRLEWINLEAWRELAEALSVAQRGDGVTVKGKWKTNQWTDRDGMLRSRDVFAVSDLDASSASNPSREERGPTNIT